MGVKSIDVTLFKKMVINGAINLQNNHKEVDQLNVFPVPDGDTGTNMSMTIMSGVRELTSCESSSIIDVAKSLSRGALMGARGNSGVILSQFFRGVYVGLKEVTHNALTMEEWMACLESGRKIAYKAVMEPVEGTILTVVRCAAEATRAKFSSFKSIEALMDCYFTEAKKALSTTPDLLPVLKEAGVVDSGGTGFCKIVEGMIMALRGEMLEAKEEGGEEKPAEEAKTEEAKQELKFTYCAEFIIELKKPDNFEEKDLKAAMSLLGDSLAVVREGNIVKVHVHTNRPGRALEIAQKQGEFITLKIENMYRSHTAMKDGAVDESNKPAEPKKKFALIAVCFGSGIISTFKDLGVDYVIEGGQTMNPSTESFVEAIKAVNAENVIIIPNNGNVIMAANQAAGLVRDVNVQVIKAKTIAQGYASLMYFNIDGTLEENVANMTSAIENASSGEITYSVRDTEIGGVKIKAGDYMGIADGEIVVSTEKKEDALNALLSKSINEESSVVTFFCGKDVTKEEMDVLEEMCLAYNSNLDVEIIEGKQDIYSYIIAFEK